MKITTLLTILAAIGVMLLGIWLLHRPPPSADQDISAGDPLIAFDLNSVGELHIQRGQDDVLLVVRDGRWVLPSAFDYPANFNRLASEVRALLRLQVGQVIRGGENVLGEFGLDPDSDLAEERPYLTLAFRDHTGDSLGTLRVGRARVAPSEAQRPTVRSDGTYMRVDDGPVLLISADLRMFPASQSDLIQSHLFELSLEDIRKLHLTLRNEDEIAVEQTGPREFVGSGLAEDEELNTARARQWFHAFRSVNFADVAGPRHQDIPDAFLPDYDRLEITTTDGRLIQLHVGEPSPGVHPYLRITILDSETADFHPDHSAFDGWTLTLPTHLQSQLILDRATLVNVREEEN